MVVKAEYTDSQRKVQAILAAIKRDSKPFKKWEEDVKRLNRRYRGEKQDSFEVHDDGDNGYNIFWSNSQTIIPSLYARTPVPQAERRFRDKDEIARDTAEIIERATRFQIEDYDFDEEIVSAVLDLTLSGRGVCRVRYEPRIGVVDVTLPDGSIVQEERVVEEAVYVEYVYWKDFQTNACRKWREVNEVRFRYYLTKEAATARFGKEKAAELKYCHSDDGLDEKSDKAEGTGDAWKKAEIWEVWKKDTRTVCWVSPDYQDDYLDEKPDPLGLKGFFPLPKPLYGTTTNDSLVPVPDYKQYSKLANQLDLLIKKERALTEDLKVAGAYDAACDEISRLAETHGDRLIPVRNWASFAQNGGFEGTIAWWPITQVVEALQVIQAEKAQVKEDIYEITGWSDIMRGATDPNETAAAQQMKGRFSSIRLTRRQKDVQRFVRDLVALTAEIIAEHFSPETLLEMTGTEFIKVPPPQIPPEMQGQIPPEQLAMMQQQMIQQRYMQCVGLLRKDPLRRFKIDIETDSTLALDEALEQQNRGDFITSVTGFMREMGQLSQQIPSAVPLMGEMLGFVARSFKAGRSVDSSINAFIEESKEAVEAMKNQQPQPDPKQLEAEAKMQLEEVKADNQKQLQEMKILAEREKTQMKAIADLQAVQHKIELERAQFDADVQLEAIKAELNAIIKTREAELKATQQQTTQQQAPQQPQTQSIPATGGTISLQLAVPKRRRRVKKAGNDPVDGQPIFLIDDEDEPQQVIDG